MPQTKKQEIVYTRYDGLRYGLRNGLLQYRTGCGRDAEFHLRRCPQ